MKIHALVLLLSFSLLTACADHTTVKASFDYAGVISKEPLLIIPAKAEANTISLSGSERMFNYEEYVEPIIIDELQKALQDKGYRATILHKKDLMDNKRYRQYEDMTSAFDTKMNSLYADVNTSKKEVALNSTVKLDGKAKALSDLTNAPVLVFANYNEQVKSSGAEATEVITSVLMSALLKTSGGSSSPDRATIRISLIDGKNDRLLWTNGGMSLGGNIIDDMIHDDKEQSLRHVRNTIKAALRSLPDKDKLFDK